MPIASTEDWTIDADEPRTFQPSPQQARFLDHLDASESHVLLEARAGSGKSTTCREGAWRLHEQRLRSTYVCFNKHVADEFQRDLPASCRAATMHSLGFNILRDTYGDLHPDADNVLRMAERYFPGFDERPLRTALARVVSLCKNTLCDFYDPEELEQLIADFGIDLPDHSDDVIAVVPEVMELCKDPKGSIDFDDMIWLPVIHGYQASRSPDVLFIDEAQDLNACQHDLINLLCPNGRIVVVGDRWQTIYAWRGADANSIPKLSAELHKSKRTLATFPLTVTRRCPKRIVELARQLVPDLDYLPDAPDGVIECVKPEAWQSVVKTGDMILCRTNAPLVSACFRLLKMGVRAFVRGRDIGKGLLVLMARLRAREVGDLVKRVSDYRVSEAAKINFLRNPTNAMEALNDKCDCLIALCEGANSVAEVKQRIETMFSDLSDENAVTLSSVHRAKGLERDHVIILKPELLPGPWANSAEAYQQERNICYVAITRAKQRLTFAGRLPSILRDPMAVASAPKS